MRTTEAIVETYFRSWLERDYATFADVLHDDVRFTGPLAQVQGRDAAVEGIRGLRELLADIRVRRRFVDGDDAVTWFELIIDGLQPIPVANWSRIDDGRISEIRVLFDPRPLLEQQ
ncbi:MAG TPA: nuclear transport factor 2 family protein [Thermomicrobiales bacterium]|nr:nuclear transport factor 2 family protein [Thermomicrobiales bacterium]